MNARSNRSYTRLLSFAIALFLSSALVSGQCEVGRLEASNGLDGDHFGSVDIDGRNVVVGAKWTDVATGSVYVYRINQAGGEIVWSEKAILEADTPDSGDNFGEDVAISGNKVVVSAFGDDDNGSNLGAAYVFAREGGVWTQEAKLLPTPVSPFASDVDIDGDRIVVGARGHQNSRGAAFVFHFDGTGWIQQPKVQPSDIEDLHLFGDTVTILGDRMAISAPGDDTYGTNTGAVYVFLWNGTEWEEEAKLTTPLTTDRDNLGFSLDFGDEDTMLVAGTSPDSSGTGTKEAAYVFRRTDSGWQTEPMAQLKASDGEQFDNFGFSVAAWDRKILVGAPFEGAAKDGAVYVFTRNGNTFSESAKLKASDAVQFDDYGSSVALYGRLGLVGAPLHPFELGPGHAYIIGMDDGLCDPPVGSPR